jgi:ABC-type Na+ efflux pump permease subunit
MRIFIGKLRAFVLVLLAIPAVVALAQSSGSSNESSISVSDAEIEKFTAALTEIQSIQRDAQAEIGGIIQESSFSRERFIEIYQADQQQSGSGQSGVDLSSEEQTAYQQTLEQITEIQQKLQSDVQDAIAGEDIQVARFNEIYSALSQSPDIQERVRSEMQEQQQQSGS